MWRVLEKKKEFEAKFVRLESKVIEKTDTGEKHVYYHVALPEFCNVIAVTSGGDVVLVRQFRAGIEAETIEVPGGLVEKGEDDIGKAALRELREETGYALRRDGRLASLGWSYPNPAMQDNRVHFFAAGPVEAVGEIENDLTEHTEVELVPLEKIETMLREGRVRHALVLNAFQLLQLSFPGESLTQALAHFKNP